MIIINIYIYICIYKQLLLYIINLFCERASRNCGPAVAHAMCSCLKSLETLRVGESPGARRPREPLRGRRPSGLCKRSPSSAGSAPWCMDLQSLRELLRDLAPLAIWRLARHEEVAPCPSLACSSLSCPPVTCGSCNCPPGTPGSGFSAPALFGSLILGVILGGSLTWLAFTYQDRPSNSPPKEQRAQIQERLRRSQSNGVDGW